MLVLSRKKNETIKIGSNIVIRVVKVGETKIKLAIEAPRSMSVRRGEVAETQVTEEFHTSLPYDDLCDELMLEAMFVQS